MTPERPRVTVCGLGPGADDRITEATASVLSGGDRVLLRTGRHPSAARVPSAETFDAVYEQATSFDEVYRTITDRVLAAAASDGHVVYAVPGSPLVLERSVRHLRAVDGIDLTLMPALSFLDEVWARLAVDPVDDGVRLVDGLRFAVDAADQRGPLLVAHVHSQWVLSDIKLAIDAGPDQRAVVLQRLGTEDELVFEVPWPELDQAIEPDHLTTLYLPELAAPVGAELVGAVEMMARLRRDCPWDRQQTHRSLRKYLVEEAYEVLEAIDGLERAGSHPGERYGHLEEELGDLLFQILFHAELAAEAGQFTVSDVARELSEKMIGRHPHVYERDPGIEPPGTVVDGSLPANWERLKHEEKRRSSVLDGIPTSLPALALTEKILKKADGAGAGAELGPLESPAAGLVPPSATADDVGMALLAIVEMARRRGISAELGLRDVIGTAARRFRAAERTGRPDRDWVAG